MDKNHKNNSPMARRTFLKNLGQGLAAIFLSLSGWLGVSSVDAVVGKCDKQTCKTEYSSECINGYIYTIKKTTCYSSVDGSFCSYGESKIKTTTTC